MRKQKYRISAGQSVCGGSVDWHRLASGGYVAQWGVSGAIEVGSLEAAAEIAADIQAAMQHPAYVYRVGEWAPPDGSERLPEYSPGLGGVLT